MAVLQSHRMHLSARERSWLPWFGKTGKLAMGWSCRLNRRLYPRIERTFEGIAATRVRLLQQWTEAQWSHLQELAAVLGQNFNQIDGQLLATKRSQAPDFSELFVIDIKGRVLRSTHSTHIGQCNLNPQALSRALQQPFLHGPYSDPLTLSIGPSSSKFHDAVTLMFYQPIMVGGQVVGCVCGRVPNDVLGDLIQREAGHIYPDSGDNYLFMVDARFDPQVQVGTALSRSRFEDGSFSLGENLKSGVHTDWGVVRVRAHTELELRFVDPATGQLHPGVRETIAKGSNMFVSYPGYADYRHIPVVGKGVTFQLPGSADRWGMMCEADLEEVYRHCSLSQGLMQTYLLTVFSVFLCSTALQQYSGLPQAMLYGLDALLLLLGTWLFSAFGPARLASRLGAMTEVIRTIAEGEGNLSQRLDRKRLDNDESGDMGRWINSFIDNLEGIVGQVINASHSVRQTNETMLTRSRLTGQMSGEVAEAIHSMLLLVEEQLGEIEQASMTAEEMKQAMDEVMVRARQQFETVRAGTQSIRDVVQRSAQSVQSLDSRMDEIGKMVGLISDITTQTNLLALNAAIEAARAGDHGRGFAVVAGEVRSLAGRTADAAEQIRTLVEGLQGQTQDAVAFMERGVGNVDASLRLTLEASSENLHLHQAVEHMFAIIKQLHQRSLNYGHTVRGVDQATSEMGQSVGVLHSSAEGVRHTANKLQQLVGQFRVSASLLNAP